MEQVYCFGVQRPIQQADCNCHACVKVEIRILEELRKERELQKANDAIIMLAQKARSEGCELIWGRSENGRLTFHTDPPKYSV